MQRKLLRSMHTEATLLGPTCCVRLHGTRTMLAFDCVQFETIQTFRPIQRDATLLANNTQQCCNVLRPFTCALDKANLKTRSAIQLLGLFTTIATTTFCSNADENFSFVSTGYKCFQKGKTCVTFLFLGGLYV